MKEVVIELKVEGANEAQQSVDSLVTSLENLQSVADEGVETDFGDMSEDAEGASESVDGLTNSLSRNTNASKTAVGISRTLNGTLRLAQTAFKAFGIENEEVNKALLKFQTAASLATGIKELATGYRALSGGLQVARTAQLGFNAAMLANPYVLAAAALAAVVVGIVAFAGSSDDAANAQEDLESSIDATNNALERQSRALDATKTSLQQNEQNLLNQINLLKAQGASIDEINKKEEELGRLKIKNAVDVINATKEQLLTVTGLDKTATDTQIQFAFRKKISDEAFQIERLKSKKEADKFIAEGEAKLNQLFTKLAQARSNATQAEADFNISQAQRQTDARNRGIQQQEKEQDKIDKKRDKADKEAEKAEKEREKLRKQTTANIIKNLDEQSKAIIENNNKELDALKQKLIEGKITEETFNAEKVLLDKKTNEEIIKFRDNFQLTQLQQFIVGNENEKEIRKKNAEEIIKLQRENANIELGIIKTNNQEKIQRTAEDEKDRIETFEREWLNKKIELLGVEGLKEEELALKLKQLEIDKNKARLELLQFGSAEYLALKEQIAQQEREIDNKTTAEAIKNQKEIQDATIELANATISSLTTLSDIYFQNQLAKAKGNAKEEEKIARKQFQINKALQLGTAIINGVNSILAITSVPDFTLGVQTAIRIGAQVALNAASIAKILSTKFQPGGGGGAATSTPSIPQLSTSGGIQPTSFAPATFGSGISQSQTFGAQQGSGGNVLRAYVSETDLTETQRRLRNIRSAGQL
jgi:hypothetical protein